MVELVFLMMAAAYVMHLVLFWNWRFSHKESYWAGAGFDAHTAVNHAVCLETVSIKEKNDVAIVGYKNNVKKEENKEPICSGL